MNPGIQISSFKPLMQDARGLECVLRAMGEMNCTCTQLQWIAKCVPIAEIARLLRVYGVEAVGVQDKSAEVFADEDYYLQLCLVTRGKDLCLSGIPDGDVDAYLAKLDALWEKAEDRGVGLSFHPVRADLHGAAQALLAARPALRLTPDTCQLHDAGVDIAAFLSAYAGRVDTVHFKDRNGQGELCPVGAGVTDFKKVFPACRDAGAKAILAEQERWKDAFGELAEGFRYVRDLVTAPEG